MLGFWLAPWLRFALAQKQPTQTTFSPHFWLVLANFLVIQWMYNHLQDDEYNQVVRLKLQITEHICRTVSSNSD